MSTHILTRISPQPSSGVLPSKAPISMISDIDPFSYENFNIVSKLNNGKFPIYLATSKINNQSYTVKVFPNSLKDSKEHYKNEIRFAPLDNSNVIRTLYHEQERGFSYIISDYASYGDFYDFITNHNKEFDDKLIRTYFRQLIEGIEYMQNVGVAHLDLKPQNLLIDADFNLKITDFDISYIIGDSRLLGRGTEYYRAPEIYNSCYSNIETSQMTLPFAADIYSAGIILFLLKSGGLHPHTENDVFEGVNLTKLMNENQSKFWAKHCEIQDKEKSFFDSNFKRLFSKMVKVDPKKRLSIKKIKQSKWYNGPIYNHQELSVKMKEILKC